ncbi:fatty acid synthase-like [Bacillus rossius redtenbacheri]|uniref:fatty acid synthase-like n=1 Tax=Bacillus rossius redtenbacheri TaxID=93214 RepID=UPI002FDD6376
MDGHDGVVVSGMSARLPESSNVEEFGEQLFAGVDLVTDGGQRWTPGSCGVPSRTGKLKNLKHFDASFFGVHSKQAHVMDPQLRMLLEVSYETIVDAGINPQSLRGSRTGVFVGICKSESIDHWCSSPDKVNGYGLIGCARSMVSNRVSYSFDLTGPSYSVACACSSSTIALQQAFNALQTDQCDAAIVAGVNLCLNPANSIAFQKSDMLSPSGCCKVFDESGDGFVRSEAVVAILIQRRSAAKRMYATVLNARTNSDGHNAEGILHRSADVQKELIQEVYSEIAVDPAQVSYVEAHGTGIKAEDGDEATTIADVFRPRCGGGSPAPPLLVSSVKSNMGHAETVAGLASVVKVLLSMERSSLPPNLHFRRADRGVPALLDGRLKVVEEVTSWSGRLAGINSFGYGGSNVHVLLERNEKSKDKEPAVGATRIAVFSGRTEQGVKRSLEKMEQMPVDDEFISLVHDLHRRNIQGHLYRGFTLLGADTVTREISACAGEKRPVWFVFSGMGSQWPRMAKDMMRLPVFAESMRKCAGVLRPEGVDLLDVVVNGSEETFDGNIVNPFVANAAMQIALVDVLRTLDIVPDGIVGHSTGEIACAYADGSLTLEQTMLAAYFRGKSVFETNLPRGAMAAVGLSIEGVKARLPPEIDIACHNSNDNVTISGPANDVRKFVQSLEEEGIFAKEVKCSGISFHSRYITKVAPSLKEYLDKVIPHPVKRSSMWVSTSVRESLWHTPQAQFSSPAYHVNNLLSPVLFADAVARIPDNSVVIEVAGHCLLQAILRRSLPVGCTSIGLMRRMHPDNVEFLFASFGKMFNAGLQPDLAPFHPAVSYPVSRGTPMIAPLVDWDHSEEWTVATFDISDTTCIGERVFDVDVRKEEYQFLTGHSIDGRIVFPASAYLDLVWKTFASTRRQQSQHQSLAVVFDTVRFHRPTVLPEEGAVSFSVKVFVGSGNFEVCVSGSLAASGRVHAPEDVCRAMLDPSFPCVEVSEEGDGPSLAGEDVYEDLRLRGYDYGGLFRGIATADSRCLNGQLTWQNNWVAFIDTVLQFHVLQKNSQELLLPKTIQKIVINPNMQNVSDEATPVPVRVYRNIGVTKAGGVEVHGVEASTLPMLNGRTEKLKLEKYCLVPYINYGQKEVTFREGKDHALSVLLQIVLENIHSKVKINLVQFMNNIKPIKPLFKRVVRILEEEPMSNVQCTVICHDPEERSAHDAKRGSSAEEGSGAKGAHLVLASGTRYRLLSEGFGNLSGAVDDGAFVLLEEQSAPDEGLAEAAGLHILSVQRDGPNVYSLLRKHRDLKPAVVVHMTERNFDWVERLKCGLEKYDGEDSRVILLCQRERLSGVVGLVNCITKEPGGHNLRCVFVQDNEAPLFSLSNPLYESQLKKDLLMNIYSKGCWGSYRNIALEISEEISYAQPEHAHLDAQARGDLSSLRWVEDPPGERGDGRPCSVHYAPVGLEDVRAASADDRQAGSLGLEFSGRDAGDRRVMGLAPGRALATTVLADPALLWEVPADWSLEEAATVPAAYCLSYYALVVRGRMQPGESLLVHAGSGGVGQAAISIALDAGLTVYTTVGSAEKRSFLKRRFPQLSDRHIFNSRDVSFEKHVMHETRGRGVDLVLNSLAEDKLLASVRCLANHGRFLQIGKGDIDNNTPLGMSVFLKNTTFHGIDLNPLFGLDERGRREVARLFAEGLKSGVVRPLPRTVFPRGEAERAFRYLAAGENIGKVLLKIRGEDPERTGPPSEEPFPAAPRTYMDPGKVYVVVDGGVGGAGFQLADWLFLRGATRVALASRSCRQQSPLGVRRWKDLGLTVLASPVDDCSDVEGAARLLKDAKELGDVGGIFVLEADPRSDGGARFKDLTENEFSAAHGAAAGATRNLDRLSRILCPGMDHFVAISPVSRGTADAVLARVCEARRQDGLPSLAVRWGRSGSGGGLTPRRARRCLRALDLLLRQPHPVVSCVAVDGESESSGAARNNADTKVCNSRVEVNTLDGNHKDILQKNCLKKTAPVISLNDSFHDVSHKVSNNLSAQ